MRKRKTNRILAVALSITMLFSVLAQPVSALTLPIPDDQEQIQIHSELSLNEISASDLRALDFSDLEVLDSSMLTYSSEREQATQERYARKYNEIANILTQTFNEPVGAIGFEGPYALGNGDELIEVAVQFVTPPAVALRLLQEYNHPYARNLDESFETHAMAAHDVFKEQLGSLRGRSIANVEIFGEHHTLFNGVFMRIPASMVDQIAELPEVFAVTPNITYHAIGLLGEMTDADYEFFDENGEGYYEFVTTYASDRVSESAAYTVEDNSVPLQGSPSDEFMRETIEHLRIEYIHEEMNITGGGEIHVAVLDTGIDYNHPVFHRYRLPLEGGGYTFRGADFINFSASPMEARPPTATSHGTHVAGTIVAIAPDIEMSHWRVLGPNGSVGNSVMLGIEGAYKDGADVMNLSLGANVNIPFAVNAYALNLASLSGVDVVISAGNSGPNAYTLGTPAVGSLPITVANAHMGGRGHVHVNGATINGNNLPLNVRGFPFGVDLDPILRGPIPYRMLGLTPSLATTPDLTGYVAVIQRGALTFVDMRHIAQTRNAEALLIIDSAVNNLDLLATALDGPRGENRIPIMHTANASAPLFANATGVIDFGDEGVTYVPLTDRLSIDSSRGPVAITYHIGPDIAGPGTRIMSAVPAFVANPDQNPYNFRYAYQLMSGTSMSAPAVAGVVALMNQQFPDARPYEIKARLMNTARVLVDGNYGVFDVGAGYVDPVAALRSGSTFATVVHDIPWLGGGAWSPDNPGTIVGGTPGLRPETMSSLSFGAVRSNDESVAARSEELTVTIHNASSFWMPQVNFNGNHAGVSLNMVRMEMVGNNHLFTFRMDFAPSATFGYYEGNLVFVSGANRITMPFAARYRYDAAAPLPLLPIPGYGIMRPIVSGFIRENAQQPDPRLHQSNTIGALTQSNISAAIFGWREPGAATSREVEFYAVQTYGDYVGRIFHDGIIYLTSGGNPWMLSDFVSARIGRQTLPEGVYEYRIFVHAPAYGYFDRGVAFNLGEFVVTNQRPDLIFDNDGHFTFGPNETHVEISGRIESWAQDMAIARNIRTIAFVETDTGAPALFDYRFAYYTLGAGLMAANADGTFVNRRLGTFDGPVTVNAAAVDGVIPQGNVALGAMLSEWTPFTYEYEGEDTELQITRLVIDHFEGIIDQEEATIRFQIPNHFLLEDGRYKGYITELEAADDTIYFWVAGHEWPRSLGELTAFADGDLVYVADGKIYTLIIEAPEEVGLINHLRMGSVTGAINQEAATITFTVPRHLMVNDQFRSPITQLLADCDTLIFFVAGREWPVALGQTAGVSDGDLVYVAGGRVYTIRIIVR